MRTSEVRLRMFVVERLEFEVVRKMRRRRRVKATDWMGSKKRARVKRRKSRRKKKDESVFPVEKTRMRMRVVKMRLVRMDLSWGREWRKRRRK